MLLAGGGARKFLEQGREVVHGRTGYEVKGCNLFGHKIKSPTIA